MENKLGLTRKAASTTAFVAYIPLNLMKRRCCWNDGHPNGIDDVDPRDVIDIDEMGLELEHQNRSFGKTVVGDRCNQVGVYNRNMKLNVLLGISGYDIDRSRWLDTWTGEGTALNRFYDFVERVVDDVNVFDSSSVTT